MLKLPFAARGDESKHDGAQMAQDGMKLQQSVSLWSLPDTALRVIVFTLPNKALSARAVSRNWKMWIEEATTIEALRTVLCELVRLDNHDPGSISHAWGLSPVQYHVSAGSYSYPSTLTPHKIAQGERLCLQRISCVFQTASHEQTRPSHPLTLGLLAQLRSWCLAPRPWHPQADDSQVSTTECTRINDEVSLNEFFEDHMDSLRLWRDIDDIPALAHGSDVMCALNSCRLMMKTLLSEYTFYHVLLNVWHPWDDDGVVGVHMDVLVSLAHGSDVAGATLTVDPDTGDLAFGMEGSVGS